MLAIWSLVPLPFLKPVWTSGGEGDNRGWYGWMASPTQWTWVWTPGVGDGQGGLVCCNSWVTKSRTWLSNWTDWTDWLTVKNRLFVWIQYGYKCIACLPSEPHGWLGAVFYSCCPASQEKIVPHILSSGKDKNSKFEVWLILSVFAFAPL